MGKKKKAVESDLDVLQEAFDKAIDKLHGDFTAEELAKAANAELPRKSELKLEDVQSYVEDELEECEELDIACDFNHKTDAYVYVKLEEYFDGAKFLIKPTELELEHGILIPGHRFIPFCHPELMPGQITLKGHDGAKVARKKVSLPSKDLMPFHSLLGFSGFYDVLVDDSKSNERIIEDSLGDTPVKISVFDMRSVYAAFQFKSGDHLVVTVKDYDGGVCKLGHLTLETMMKSVSEIRDWNDRLSEGLDSILEEMEPFALSIPQILSQALYRGGRTLVETPMSTIGAFLSKSEEFSIQNVMDQTTLWHKDVELDMDDLVDDMDDQDGLADLDPDSLDGLLGFLGYNLNESDVTAYMKDELYNGGDSFERACRWKDDRGVGDAECEDAIHDLERDLQEIWDDIREDYNRFEDKGGALRTEMLRIKDAHLAWLRTLDDNHIDPKDMPKEEVYQLMQLTSVCDNMLAMLNDPEECAKISNQEKKQVMEMIEKIKPVFELLTQAVNDKLKE